VTLYAACEGTSYDCDTAARALMAGNVSQACASLGAAGLTCTP